MLRKPPLIAFAVALCVAAIGCESDSVDFTTPSEGPTTIITQSDDGLITMVAPGAAMVGPTIRAQVENLDRWRDRWRLKVSSGSALFSTITSGDLGGGGFGSQRRRCAFRDIYQRRNLQHRGGRDGVRRGRYRALGGGERRLDRRHHRRNGCGLRRRPQSSCSDGQYRHRRNRRLRTWWRSRRPCRTMRPLAKRRWRWLWWHGRRRWNHLYQSSGGPGWCSVRHFESSGDSKGLWRRERRRPLWARSGWRCRRCRRCRRWGS